MLALLFALLCALLCAMLSGIYLTYFIVFFISIFIIIFPPILLFLAYYKLTFCGHFWCLYYAFFCVIYLLYISRFQVNCNQKYLIQQLYFMDHSLRLYFFFVFILNYYLFRPSLFSCYFDHCHKYLLQCKFSISSFILSFIKSVKSNDK